MSRRPLDTLLLELVKERKLRDLLSRHDLAEKLEASGVVAVDHFFYVIFDNRHDIARLQSDLSPDHNNVLAIEGEGLGFEDIAYNPRDRRFYLLVEAVLQDDGLYKAKVIELNDDFDVVQSNYLDFALKRENKGIEGLVYIHRSGHDYLLALCEGNKCKGGDEGREPGGGRIQIFRWLGDTYEHGGQIKLPKTVRFEDYAGIDIDENNRVVVVSQASSLLWVGRLKDTDWEMIDPGLIYEFPKNEHEETLYCNVVGVSWIGPNQIVVVSDRTKSGEQPDVCKQKDQMVHIFNIPSGTSPPAMRWWEPMAKWLFRNLKRTSA